MVVIKKPTIIGVIEGLLEVEAQVGDFIANGPEGGIAGHVRDKYRERCNQFANAPGWAQALLEGPKGTLGRMCQPYWDEQGVDGPTNEPPFEGGQCATTYTVSLSYTVVLGFCGNEVTSTEVLSSNALGPISVTTDNSSTAGGGADLCDGFSYTTIRVNGASGNIGQRGSGLGVRLDNLDVSRNDAAADNCGDPAPVLQPGPNPPPNPPPTPGPEPTTDPDDPTGAPLLPIPPYIDPIGGPTPIVGPDPNPTGVGPDDIPGNTDSQEGGPENVGEPIAVNPGPGGGGDDVDFGEPPDGRVWVGCLLQFAIPEAYGNIAGSGPANTVTARVFGNASLVFANGRGTAYRVNSSNIDLFRSSGALKVTGVYVNVAPGITYNVRPVSVEKCPENSCGAA